MYIRVNCIEMQTASIPPTLAYHDQGACARAAVAPVVLADFDVIYCQRIKQKKGGVGLATVNR